jgi:AcrR family transcriptional regulator
MPRDSQATRARILDAAYSLFYREGFARIGVDQIAARARVTKRTLYYHFDSKDAVLAAVMETQNELALARIRVAIEAGGRDAAEMVCSLFTGIAKWAATPNWHGPGFTRIAMELASLPGHPARAIARRHKAAFEAMLAERLSACGLAEARAAARQLMLLNEGCMALILIHGDTRYAQAAQDAALRLVGAPTSRSPSAARSRGRGRRRPARVPGSASRRTG